MRTLIAMMLLTVLAAPLLSGCSLFRSEDDQLPPVPADPNRIEIMCLLANPEAPPTMIKLALEKGKPGTATITSGVNPQGSVQPLPPETFEQCQALLAKTDFFHMKSARPSGAEGTQSRSLFIVHNGHDHAVEERLPSRASPQFDEVMQFVLSRIKSGPG